MNQVNSRVLCLAGVILFLSACEGGRDAVNGSRHAGDSNAFDGGIGALVNGVPYRFSGDMRVVSADAGRKSLNVVSLSSDQSHWDVLAVTPEPGRYLCEEQGLRLQLMREGMPLLSSAGGGQCELTISVSNLERIRGQFSGQLLDAQGRTHRIEEGLIDIMLASAIPDLDEDGWSDADDNCPFIANADQADADGNLRGDACDGSDSESSSS